MTKQEQYEQELESQFDWEGLKQDIVQNAVETLHDFTLDELRLHDLTDGEAIVGQAYIGTVFELTPSGKYYMPFACSNVEACPECQGDGHARAMCKFNHEENTDNCFDHDGKRLCGDCDYNEKREPITEPCQYCQGQGERDLYELAELRNETPTETAVFLINTYNVEIRSDGLGNEVFDCNVCHGSGEQFVTCSTCQGLGSAEAYQDQEWYEALESVTDRHGMWYTAGEGSATDIMVGAWVSFAEIVRYVLDEHVKLIQAWLDGQATIRDVKGGLRVAKSLINKMNQLERGE